jgi:G6PDH family F420-dependent oxidoreductase
VTSSTPSGPASTSVISDHYSPWLDAQGHAPYAWSVLGAAAQATDRIGLMTYVTCPTKRYHPVVVAQKAATVALLSDGRFTLGLGAGENFDEHVVGGGWPPANVRRAQLEEAVHIIKALWGGGRVCRCHDSRRAQRRPHGAVRTSRRHRQACRRPATGLL